MTPNERAKAWYEAHKNDPAFKAKKLERAKAFREANRDYQKEYQKRYRESDQGKRTAEAWRNENRKHLSRLSWETHIRTKYGLESEDVARLLEAQGLACAIHKGLFGEEEFCVDHRASQFRVRGLLCHDCNVSIGRMRENSEALRNAALYLDFYNS